MRMWEISQRANSPKNNCEPVRAEPIQTDALELLRE
jgi:hypothetical protein